MEESIKNIRDTILKFGERAVEDYQKEDVASLTGARTDNYLSLLSGYSAMLEERMGELEVLEAKFMVANRDKWKSNADTEIQWKGSDAGLDKIVLKRQLNACDKVISACKNRLKRLQQESFNQI